MANRYTVPVVRLFTVLMNLFAALSSLFQPAKPPVFISYDHSEDRRYRDLLCAWNANSKFVFGFERCSPMVAINSKQAAHIKAALAAMMAEARYLLVIVGEKTHASRWIRWEITKAKKMNLKLVVIKLHKSNQTPYGLLNAGASFAYSFSQQTVLQALEAA